MQCGEWRGKAYSFYRHAACESFPCHTTNDLENFNCLFCYCPLYMLDEQCGGDYVILPNGVKDCSDCTIPHVRENYGLIVDRYRDIVEKMRKTRVEKESVYYE